MDVFDFSDYTKFLPRRVGRYAALALAAAVVLCPPVRAWYIGQAETHGEHIADEILDDFLVNRPSPSTGYKSADP